MRKESLAWLDDCDRVSENEDGSRFYGFDDEETGTTTWYDEDGNCDSITDIPREYGFS